MHKYCTPHIIKRKLWEFLDPLVQLHTPISSVLCMITCLNRDNAKRFIPCTYLVQGEIFCFLYVIRKWRGVYMISCFYGAQYTVKQFAQHVLLLKQVDRVCCGLTVCAAVWRLSNRFEFRCTTISLYNSSKLAWTCLWAVVPRHQFIIDSHTVRVLFSKCHI
jgi:hypothetical protein